MQFSHIFTGCLATTAALTTGLYNFRTGNRKMSQIMMRTRIAAQGFTVIALIVGVVMTYGDKKWKLNLNWNPYKQMRM